MSAETERMAIKTALLAPAGPITAWGVQKFLSDEPFVGAAALAIATMFVAGYVAIQEYDLPYEDEIIEIVSALDPEETEEAAKDVAEEVGDEVDDYTQDDDSETEG